MTYTQETHPELTFSNKLPDRDEYKCPASCGCNKLQAYKWNDLRNQWQTYCADNGNKVHYVAPNSSTVDYFLQP